MLDTNTCIYIRGKQPKVSPGSEKLDAGEVGIFHCHLWRAGLRVAKSAGPTAQSGIGAVHCRYPVFAMPVEAGQTYGKLRAALEMKGEIIGPNDLWIAAHALVSI